MCYETKRKIAECVKLLMKKKEIRKITIHDIMVESNMSRQSFYYHFKDIYDVLEWIYIDEIATPLTPSKECMLRDWLLEVFHIVTENESFLYHVVTELEWPRIFSTVKPYFQEQLVCVLQNQMNHKPLSKECLQQTASFLTTSYMYFIMDCIYSKRVISDETISKELDHLGEILAAPMIDSVLPLNVLTLKEASAFSIA